MTTRLKTKGNKPAAAAHFLVPFRPTTIRQTFVVENRNGLHCRPAVLLVKTLGKFDCQSTVHCNGASANPHNIFELMGLAAGCGSVLEFKMIGPDAAAAMAAIQRVFATNFAAAYAEQNRFTAHNST